MRPRVQFVLELVFVALAGMLVAYVSFTRGRESVPTPACTVTVGPAVVDVDCLGAVDITMVDGLTMKL